MATQAEIGNLRVSLGINTAQFAAGLAQAQGSLGTFGESLKKFAAIAAGALSFTAVTAAMKSSIDHMDELSKAAQKIGIPTDELSKLEYAAKLADVSLDDLTTTLAKFSKNIAEIAAGGENDASKALDAIGVSAVDAQGKLRPTTAIMGDIADEFSTMEDGAGKTALAIALFGKSGAEMIPLLNGGRDAISEASAELEKFGGVVTPEAGVQAENFNDNLTRLHVAIEGLTQSIVAPLLPTLINMTQVLVDLAKNSNTSEDATSGLKYILEQTTVVALHAYESFYALAKIIGVFQENLANPTSLDEAAKRWDAAFEAIRVEAEKTEEAISKITNPGVTASQSDVKSMLDNIDGKSDKKPAPTMAASGGSSTKAAAPAKSGSLDDIYGKGFTKSVEDTTQSFEDLWKEMESGISTSNSLNESFQNMTTTLVDGLSSAIVGLISGTTSLEDAFKSMAESIVQQLEKIAQEIIASEIFKLLGMVFGANVSPSQQTFLGSLFTPRAIGGPVTANGTYLVGENGPELFSPYSSGRIIPNDQLGGGSSPQMNVTVINNSSAHVSTRKNSSGNLEVTVDEILAEKVLRGGSKIDAALSRAYGLRRAGR